MQKDYWPQMTLMRQMTTDEYFAMRHKHTLQGQTHRSAPAVGYLIFIRVVREVSLSKAKNPCLKILSLTHGASLALTHLATKTFLDK